MPQDAESTISARTESISRILITGIALLVLLAATSWAAFLPLGRWKLPTAMAISTLKLILIALSFMRLRQAGRSSWVFAVAGLLWIMILAGLTLADVLTRFQPY